MELKLTPEDVKAVGAVCTAANIPFTAKDANTLVIDRFYHGRIRRALGRRFDRADRVVRTRANTRKPTRKAKKAKSDAPKDD